MDQALELARRAEGLTRPNPPVGAIVVRQGSLVGRGWHHAAGKPHAEILALGMAGPKARGATLYVTLEPCSTAGQTLPCVPAIIQSGIQHVVIAARDPNPRHYGRGVRWLRRGGIEVIEKVRWDQAQDLLKPFAKWVTTEQPLLTLKLALTIDGKIADSRRRSRWITGAKARREVQGLRRSADAILVGAGTVLADNPSLLPKPAMGRQPLRVILDARGVITTGAQVLNDGAQQHTIMVTTKLCPLRRRQQWLAQGAQVWVLPTTRQGLSLPTLMKRLGKLGILHVLCEGGGKIAGALIRAHLVDAFIFYLAPRLLGASLSVNAVAGRGWPLATAPHLIFTDCRRLGKDIVITALPRQCAKNKNAARLNRRSGERMIKAALNERHLKID